jgi:hypothetical protein
MNKLNKTELLSAHITFFSRADMENYDIVGLAVLA